MALGIEGYGSFLGYGQDGVNFTSVGEVFKIGGPDIKGKAIDVTHLLSPFGWMEFYAGVVDGGEVTLNCNFIGSQVSILKLQLRSNSYYWRVTFSTGSTATFRGFVTGLNPAAPVDDRLTYDVTIKVNGYITFTA